ncbi:MAG: hypothetical protein KR126chlam2_00553 [Chlamydiae bacterium]|nr:hypothetical protein [Chlamydiota bacterium]
MHFTREPIIETIITPKEGHKLVIRNSKGGGQEEFFVDAIEVIAFGQSSFYRSQEKPKSFVVPISDYEILEVRETRMVLKASSVEKGIKIGGGREATLKVPQEEGTPVEPKRKEQRRRQRKRRIRADEPATATGDEKVEKTVREEKIPMIPPPTTLISETIARYKEPQIAPKESAEPKEQPVVVPELVQKEVPPVEKPTPVKSESEPPNS